MLSSISSAQELSAYLSILVAATTDKLAEMFPFLADELGEVDAWYQRQHVATQTATAVAGIVIGAALLIGFFVIATIDDALPAISDSDLSTDKNSTVDRVGDGLLMGGVVVIVMFAALILRTLRSI